MNVEVKHETKEWWGGRESEAHVSHHQQNEKQNAVSALSSGLVIREHQDASVKQSDQGRATRALKWTTCGFKDDLSLISLSFVDLIIT